MTDSVLTNLLNATWAIGGAPILVREIIGNLFGLASAVGGMRRVVWAWPVGIIGNVLLFTVFLGGLFHTPQDLDLYGQAGRQVMFLIVSIYGWWRWSSARKTGMQEPDHTPAAQLFLNHTRIQRQFSQSGLPASNGSECLWSQCSAPWCAL